MQSEWMTAKPENFETEWFMIACPTGKRQMVLSGQGTTCSQNKMGWVKEGFRSLLPGGNPSNGRGSAIVDCIFSKSDNTFYIIDIMYWKDQNLQDCDADFRYYWLKNRIKDENWTKDLHKVTKLNEHKFLLVNDVPCTKQAMEEELNSVQYQIDGLLFFKRASPYVNGTTDDCLWLKPHMLSDIIGEEVALPDFQKYRRPADFSFEKHVEKVKKEREERKNKGKPKWARKPRLNINQLVDEISQMYIDKHGGVVPEGVHHNPPPPQDQRAPGIGRGRGMSKQPLVRPAKFNPDQLGKSGKYVGTEDYEYDGETFAHMGGYRDESGGLGVTPPGGEYVAHTGAYRYTSKGGFYAPEEGYGDYSGGQRKGAGRGMLGVNLTTPQYNMWGYTNNKPVRGRGSLLNYQKTHQHFK